MQRFEFDDGRNERIEPSEAQRVVERWMAQQNDPSHDWPSVQDLAEALKTTPEQVRRLLAEVRTSDHAAIAQPRQPLIPAKVWHLGLGLAAVFVLLVFMAVLFAPTAGEPTAIATGSTYNAGAPTVASEGPVKTRETAAPTPVATAGAH